MPRPKKTKVIHGLPIPVARAIYKPAGIPLPALKVTQLSIAEFEALRLIDCDGLPQNEAARLMDVSQPTISRILNSARHKIADAVVGGKALNIEGGADFKFSIKGFSCLKCKNEWSQEGSHAPERCPKCGEPERISVLQA
nr:DUF134 domain-containing protein [Candidatus Sigynarchaeota archaeon]